MTAGKMNSNMVWLFALGAILLGIGGGYATANMGMKVSSAVFLGIFAIGGFCASFLTQAGAGKAILAMVTASLVTGVIYYVVISKVMATAAAELSSGANGSVAVGAMFGGFAAAIVFLETLAAGITGALVGKKAKAGSLEQAVR